MVSRSVLGDVGLALLGVVTVAAAGYVLVRDPLPVDTTPLAVASAAPSPSAPPAPAVLPTPSASAIDVVLLRGPGTPGGHALVAAQTLGWRLTGTALAAPRTLTGQEVVLVQAGQDDEAEVLRVVREVRAEAASARLVVVGPLVPVSAGDDALERAVEAAGGELLDPAALGWLQDRGGVFTSTGGFTPEGARDVGADLAAALTS